MRHFFLITDLRVKTKLPYRFPVGPAQTVRKRLSGIQVWRKVRQLVSMQTAS